MATTNVIVYDSWTKVVDLGDDFTLSVQPPFMNFIEVAAVDADAAPIVDGHRIKSPEESINRALTGPGYVYARVLSAAPSQAKVIVSSWTP